MSSANSLLPFAAARPTRMAEGTSPTCGFGAVRKAREALAGWCDAVRKRRTEVRAWQEARTFEDIAVLTAHWLRGLMLWHPNGHHGGPDPETMPLVDVLAAANLAGILTDNSQPGELVELHERPWQQRAFVTAFVADPALARALCARATEAGLVVRVYRPGSRVDERGERGAVDVTLWGTSVNTGMGDWLPPRAVRRILPGCDRQAVREVAAAWQVTLIDPVWGRNTVLWPLLGRFLDSWAHGGLDEGDEQR
ncbi:hypothetical protein [Streptomyces sp. CdTB01]|uniref:DUF6919 domain-containing protein n=1 Tax=Streptomyces sp. CdTB01 TaxID=1725411 RepID=UPI00073A8CE9|nr:hypothetical protein [Streptomyces sp. CdTB01]ALV39329.1 hypothetical protein AS200_45435 [Streptomyces sp. CdTB01]